MENYNNIIYRLLSKYSGKNEIYTHKLYKTIRRVNYTFPNEYTINIGDFVNPLDILFNWDIWALHKIRNLGDVGINIILKIRENEAISDYDNK